MLPYAKKNLMKCEMFFKKSQGSGGLSKCSLCTAIVEDNIQYSACLYCIHRNFRDFAAPCVYHETYEAIEKSKNLDELMEAIRNRADYLEELIEKVKNDN